MQEQPGRKWLSWRLAGFFFFAFLGGMAAQMLIHVAPVLASQQVWGRILVVNDPETNRYGVQTFVQRGGTAQKFHDPAGIGRLQMGTYGSNPDGNTGEQGMPMFALSDSQGRVRVLLRLRGESQTPVLIFRDSDLKDRMVLGLEDNAGQEPYLTTYDSSGQQTVRFNKLQ